MGKPRYQIRCEFEEAERVPGFRHCDHTKEVAMQGLRFFTEPATRRLRRPVAVEGDHRFKVWLADAPKDGIDIDFNGELLHFTWQRGSTLQEAHTDPETFQRIVSYQHPPVARSEETESVVEEAEEVEPTVAASSLERIEALRIEIKKDELLVSYDAVVNKFHDEYPHKVRNLKISAQWNGYWTTSEQAWASIFDYAQDWLNNIPPRDESFDIDPTAKAFVGLVALHFNINSIGFLWDFVMRETYCCLLINNGGDLALRYLDPTVKEFRLLDHHYLNTKLRHAQVVI